MQRIILAFNIGFVAYLSAGSVPATQQSEKGCRHQPVVRYEIPLKPAPAQVIAQRCCEICRKGKACGNSCISE